MTDLNHIRSAVAKAITTYVSRIDVEGIEAAELSSISVDSQDLQQATAKLWDNGHGELVVLADIRIYLRLSNEDVLGSNQQLTFRVSLNGTDGHVLAAAAADASWERAWEGALEPLKPFVLESLRTDVQTINPAWVEGTYGFQAAMVLLASEMLGPYASRISTFLDYSPSLVQVIGSRLYEAGIWEKDEVRCESWFDPLKGGMALRLDIMVAEGKLQRRWSEEHQQFRYYWLEGEAIAHLAI